MEKEVSRNIRVGIVLIITTVILISALYIIGDKRNIFGSTFRVSAMFYNVNGLMPGNNVRLSGINVGTVESVEIINDSVVSVSMLIENKVSTYITTSAVASIGTDGLMGNKLVNINSSNKPGRPMKDGDVLQTLAPFETDEMIRTLNTTNENIKYITTDLKKITQKINSPNTLWSLLMDTVVAENVKTAIVNIKVAGDRAATATGDLKSIISNVKEGKGSIGSLLNDTSFSGKLDYSMTSIKQIADKMTQVSENLETVSNKLKNGDGVIGTLLTDTSLTNNLSKSLENLKDGTAGFNENMEALKHNILLRRYFKKKNSKNPVNKQ
jgi:phospholipid/cholesterol/gamma-HCH transport system substrate-binding protein